MSATLTLTIDSGDYVDADKALRVFRADFRPGTENEYVKDILEARRKLGFSMHPQHVLIDYDPKVDGCSVSYVYSE